MTLSIRTKLFFAIFIACLVTVGGVSAAVQYKFKSSFLDYLNAQENRSLSQVETQLIEWYNIKGNWQGLVDDPRLWEYVVRTAMRSSLFPASGDSKDDPPSPTSPDFKLPPPHPHEIDGIPPPLPPARQRVDRFMNRVVLLDTQQKIIQGNTRLGIPENLHELKSHDQIVGYLGLHKRQNLTEKVDVEFADNWQHIIWFVGLISLPVTGLLAFLLSRHLGRPIQALRNGTRQLTDGDYSLRMKPQGKDELGQLTRDFNKLAERLQQTEASRKQWIADIAHELRTPLSILRGEIEALQDGINQPDTHTFASLHQEATHLQHLVDDLYNLSMSDSGALTYHRISLDIVSVLRETLTLHSTLLQDQNLQIDTLGISPKPISVQGDPQRLQQLFQNLIENSLRYTDKPGQLRVSTNLHPSWVEIVFEDSPPGVPDEALPRLFERLFRVESSRNRATGGSGLGLSICQNIVAAHDGFISAQHSALGGLGIIVKLPLKS